MLVALWWIACAHLFVMTHSHAVEVTSGQFHKIITQDADILVMFYAPWCPHCQDAKPKFQKAAEKIKNDKKILALVNCEEGANSQTCTKENIKGYPTVRLYRNGQLFQDYHEELTEHSFVDFMRSIPSLEELEKMEPHRSRKDYTDDEDTTVEISMKHVKYLEGATANSYLVNQEHVMLFFYAPWCQHCQHAKPEYDKAAKILKEDKTFSDRILCAINCELTSNQKFCNDQKTEGYPTLRYYNRGQMYQEYEDEILADSIVKFMKQPPKIPVPPTPIIMEDEERDQIDSLTVEKQFEIKDIQVLTNETFKKIVSSKSQKGTFIMFFSMSQCPHCQQSINAFQSAAEVLSDLINIHFAIVNCDRTENKEICQKRKLKEHPTFELYKNGKRLKDYNEKPASVKGIAEFLKKENVKVIGKDEL